jgi:nucleoside-diphosphate-sugar epimerase
LLKKNLSISGGSGFLAKNLSNYLDREKYNVTLITRSNRTKELIEARQKDVLVKVLDWNDIDQISETLKNTQILIHAGATLPTRSDANDYNIIRSSLKIAKNICKSNLKLEQFIFISTLRTCIEIGKEQFNDDSVYNFYKYDTAYGRSKYLTEKYFIKYKDHLPLIICSPAHIVGPENELIAKSNNFMINYLKKKIVFYTSTKYAIIDILDVCKAIDLIISKSEIGKKYLLCSHNPTLKDIIRISGNITSKKIKIFIPMFILNFLSWIFDILNKKLRFKNIPLNRSSYNFAKLNTDFIGKNINELGMKYQNLDAIIIKIKNYLENCK